MTDEIRLVHDAVLAAWCEILGVTELSPADGFFALGGDSMAAIMVIERLEKELDVSFPLESLFIDDRFESVVATFLERRARA